jgi:hypothetical protein
MYWRSLVALVIKEVGRSLPNFAKAIAYVMLFLSIDV